MSGVCGVVSWGERLGDGVVESMLEAVPWRGADGTAVWYGEGAGLGFARLAITPEDGLESQPWVDGQVTVVADCRLDDRQTLIAQVADQGPWRWGTPTDVELIARAYRQWGTDCASHLLGDFAFAVWDHHQHRLLLARDPMGMRPLYYHHTPQRILFASEIKQILTHPHVPRRIHEPHIAAHLCGIYGPIESTAYEGITQLGPATTLTTDQNGAHTHTHWQPDPHHRIHLPTETDYAHLLRDTLTQAVQDRLRTNHQTGLLLSGGMDSGAIASIAGQLHQQNPTTTPLLHTYTWAFTQLPQCDERSTSRHITNHYQLPTHDIPADELWPLAHYPKHGPDPDDPYTGAYQALIEHTLQTATDTGTRHLLGGDRGDEVVGDRVYDTWGLLRSGKFGAAADGARHWLHASGGRRGLARWLMGRRPQPRLVPRWLGPDLAASPELEDLVAAWGTPRNPWDLRRSTIFEGHPPRVAVLHERTRSRFGLGSVDAWSDRRVAEAALAMPPSVIQRRGEPKRIMRSAIAGVMPDPALTSTAKIEPTALYQRGLWHEARPTVEELFEKPLSGEAGYVDAAALLAAYRAWAEGGPPSHDFWWAISLEMWMRSGW